MALLLHTSPLYLPASQAHPGKTTCRNNDKTMTGIVFRDSQQALSMTEVIITVTMLVLVQCVCLCVCVQKNIEYSVKYKC